MFRRLYMLTITLFLLFHVTSIAEENQDNNTETVEEVAEGETVDAEAETEVSTDVAIESDETEGTEEADTEKEEISAAQREADEAEAAELREVGEGEEPVAE